MTKEQIQSLNIGIDVDDNTAFLSANAALEWIAENTTIDTTDIEHLPYRAKLFINKFCEVNAIQSGISSESIDGLSQSFASGDNANLIMDLANSLLSSDLKSRVRFVTAERKWK